MDKQYLSTTELASLLGVSRITIFNRIKKGNIGAKKIGRNFIINKADLPPELIPGHLNEQSKKEIQNAVKKTIEEYSETLQLLGKE